MNPPSALHGAMSRERKPFTYTPGGLDLSEIKSERMAKRLMRNAMNQGVPEVPIQQIQSPPMPSTPIAVPNFNCLPVQVFPTINLPANPKSLLRTRSNPDQPRNPPMQKIAPPMQPQFGNNTLNRTEQSTPFYSQTNNSNFNRPVSMYEYGMPQNNNDTSRRLSYGTDQYTPPTLPEIRYDAEYCQVPPKANNSFISAPLVPFAESNEDIKLISNENLETKSTDFIVQPILDTNTIPTQIVSKPVEDDAAANDEQKQVKIVKKQVKKEQKIENGEQNGEENAEAEMTVKLPTKKSAAKTETKVEVNKTILPDGSVEEVKVTTTKTTIDGRTEIKTKTEKKIIPKEESEEEVEEEEEEQEEENEVVVQEVEEKVTEEPKKVVKTVAENGQKEVIVKKEETTSSTTKKVVVVQKEESEEEEEEEEVEEVEPVVVKKPVTPKPVVEKEEEEEEEVIEETKEVKSEAKVEEKEVEETVVVKVAKKEEPPKKEEPQQEEEEEEEVEEEYEEAEDKEEKVEEKVVEETKTVKVVKEEKQEEEESEYTEEEYESEKEEVVKKETVPVEKAESKEEQTVVKEETPEVPEPQPEQPAAKPEESKPQPEQPKPEEPAPQPEQKAPLREPSIPLEKVEEVEIKPIGAASEVISKSHTENTEILKSSNQQQTGPYSTQTEYNRIENIVTVNRTTKTLDHSYEQLTQQGVPTVKTYFAPSRERIGASPQPSRPYQPVYAPEAPTERRHSLLLDRLSVERQAPSSDIYQNTYQYSNQTIDQQRQWSQEPQSEVLNVSNVKPSKITNQQWYQQKDNVLYNNVTPAVSVPASQPWNQQSQPQYQPQPQPQPQPQYQPSYTESTTQDRTSSSTFQQNNYSGYVPKPTNWASSNVDSLPSINTQSNQYSFLSKDASESYQTSTQQYSSSYVPPPWEQDSSYVADTSNQNYYQPPPLTNAYTVEAKPGWKPSPPNKFSKTAPTSYIPPAPNQSFVKTVNVGAEPPMVPGRKTYYSEYERRYITVPESTYIPSETKFQPQPDPSPQYYYDNNEPTETVEHEWRKELREFTEKTSQVEQQTTDSSVRPPWEEDPKYVKTPSTYTPTPTWSQTLRPQSCRERSFESEYVGSQEYPKTNTLGRGRPLSSYGKIMEAPIPERARGVSVDRYNPNNYQAPIPAEHPPVQTHTLAPTPPAKSYHNPNVPAYHTHTRASAEPREQPQQYPQARLWGCEARGTPIQSRSFKYLQWITGTED